ncbi:MAG TPA: gliding motility-associated C-terminal domain-containing protein [Fulvivirga sp.]|nr:gliding motility-associated C-terminal domain-containing protein [Fulvivirga sp.]
MKRLIILIFLIILTESINAQNQNEPIRYRVVAVNSTDNTIESVSNIVELYLPMKIYLPTAFSPNGDGLNDTFGAVGEGIEKYKLTVYNRWGEEIFASNDVSTKWDGLHKGTIVPFGAYNYELLAYGKEFGEVHKTGHVIVVN